MSENNQLPVVFSDAQRDIVLMQTPPGEIKWRKGRGEKLVPYVEIGYVAETLNLACGFDWDFDIVSQEYHAEIDEIVVLGKLTIRAGGRAVSKTQYGGSDVKRKSSDNSIICLADDFKAAASDALKKCASLLGVAHDVYRGRVEAPPGTQPGGNNGEPPTTRRKKKPAKRQAAGHWIEDETVRKRFWAWAKAELGLSEADVHAALNVISVKDFTGTKREAFAILEEYAAEQAASEPAEIED